MIIQTENYHEKEKLDYVLDFHERTFDKEAARELTKYLESDADGNNSQINLIIGKYAVFLIKKLLHRPFIIFMKGLLTRRQQEN